jgi:3,4-dihydroxy-2-butanone 4-phosphate synthase
MVFSEIEEAVKDLQRGKCIIVVDDEHRENEGDLIIAAEKITPMKINFMLNNGKGLVCVPLLGERLDKLNLPLMVSEEENNELTRCSFTVSVDYKKGTTTGISASDRAATVKALIDENSKSEDFARPGHIFPLRYKEGGVIERPGHTEAAIDLCKMAKLYPAAVICEILKEDGETAKLEELEDFAKKHRMSIISIEELIKYRKEKNI